MLLKLLLVVEVTFWAHLFLEKHHLGSVDTVIESWNAMVHLLMMMLIIVV